MLLKRESLVVSVVILQPVSAEINIPQMNKHFIAVRAYIFRFMGVDLDFFQGDRGDLNFVTDAGDVGGHFGIGGSVVIQEAETIGGPKGGPALFC